MVDRAKVKGVIVAAGYGTRFLPVTKTIPKEMVPLVDRPAIDLLIQEFVEAGIEDVVLIISRRRKALEDYFDHEIELEWFLQSSNSHGLLSAIKPPPLKVVFARQDEMRGTGHAILQAKPYAQDGPFIVAYPDDLFLGGESFSRTLIRAHQATGKCVLGVVKAGPEIARLSSIEYEGGKPPFRVKRVVEKPLPGTEPSHIASIGRYLFTPDLLDLLEEGWRRHKGPGEFYHIDAINELCGRGQVVAVFPEGRRLDIGVPETYLEAFVEYALSDQHWRPRMLEIVRRVAERELAMGRGAEAPSETSRKQTRARKVRRKAIKSSRRSGRR